MLPYALSFLSGLNIAFSFIAFYVFSNSKGERFYFYFSIFSLFSGLYFLVQAVSIFTQIDMGWAIILCAAIYYAIFPWFVFDFIGKKPNIFLWLITLVFVFAYATFFIDQSEYLSGLWQLLAHTGLVALMGVALIATKKLKLDNIPAAKEFGILTIIFILLGTEEIIATHTSLSIFNKFFNGFLPLDLYPVLFTLVIGRRLSFDITSKKKLEIQVVKEALNDEKLKVKELEKIKLETALFYKNKDLTDFSIDIARKNEFAQNLFSKLSSLKKYKSIDPKELSEVISFTKSHIQIDNDLELLQNNADLINNEFTSNLKNQCPKLTPSDLQLASLLRLKLSTKEIAEIKNVSSDSVKVMRYRLRKKLELSTETSLSQFLNNY